MSEATGDPHSDPHPSHSCTNGLWSCPPYCAGRTLTLSFELWIYPACRGQPQSLAFLRLLPKGRCCFYCALFFFSSLFYEDHFMTRDFCCLQQPCKQQALCLREFSRDFRSVPRFPLLESPHSWPPFLLFSLNEETKGDEPLPLSWDHTCPFPYSWTLFHHLQNEGLVLPTLKSLEDSDSGRGSRQHPQQKSPAIHSGQDPRSPVKT